MKYAKLTPTQQQSKGYKILRIGKWNTASKWVPVACLSCVFYTAKRLHWSQ